MFSFCHLPPATSIHTDGARIPAPRHHHLPACCPASLHSTGRSHVASPRQIAAKTAALRTANALQKSSRPLFRGVRWRGSTWALGQISASGPSSTICMPYLDCQWYHAFSFTFAVRRRRKSIDRLRETSSNPSVDIQHTKAKRPGIFVWAGKGQGSPAQETANSR